MTPPAMLIALDIDGTIIDWDERMSARVSAAVAGAAAARSRTW